jgi:hypothetical protein
MNCIIPRPLFRDQQKRHFGQGRFHCFVLYTITRARLKLLDAVKNYEGYALDVFMKVSVR